VNVELDYTKPAGTTADGRALPEKHFYTVTDGKINVALQLVERGLAKVVFHSDENRSPIYQSLVVAEKQAQSKGKGVWRAGKSEAHHINDITIRDGDKKGVDVKKAKQVRRSHTSSCAVANSSSSRSSADGGSERMEMRMNETNTSFCADVEDFVIFEG